MAPANRYWPCWTLPLCAEVKKHPSDKTPLRHQWRRWWMNRLPSSDTLVLTHRNVYILPTRAGVMLGLTLLLLLVASINYQLNLGYLLTFLLAGCSTVALHVTHNNLRGVQLKLAPHDPIFAGHPMGLDIDVQAPGRRARYALNLRWAAPPEDTCEPPDGAWADIPEQANTTASLSMPAPQRGWHTVPAIKVESLFPMGIFRVWSWWRPAGKILVYPAPENPAPPLPASAGQEDATIGTQAFQGDELDNLRPWRNGDPLNRVVWKKAAKQPEQDNWVSRDASTTEVGHLWLATSTCGASGKEAQMSRLCAWVLDADKRGLEYGLKLPTQTIPLGQGTTHRQQCLEALALC